MSRTESRQTKKDLILKYARKHDDEEITQSEIANAANSTRHYVGEVLIEHYPEHSTVRNELKRDLILEYASKHDGDVTQSEIAEAANAARGYVSEVLSEHYPEHTAVQRVTKRELILQYAEDHPDSTQREIADDVGTSMSYVSLVLGKHRPHHLRKRVADDKEQKIRELASQTPLLSVPEIANRCDVAYSVVRRVMQDVEVEQ